MREFLEYSVPEVPDALQWQMDDHVNLDPGPLIHPHEWEYMSDMLAKGIKTRKIDYSFIRNPETHIHILSPRIKDQTFLVEPDSKIKGHARWNK